MKLDLSKLALMFLVGSSTMVDAETSSHQLVRGARSLSFEEAIVDVYNRKLNGNCPDSTCWDCTAKTGCFECKQIVPDPNDSNYKLVTMDFSGCKGSAISWACCVGSTIPPSSCTVVTNPGTTLDTNAGCGTCLSNGSNKVESTTGMVWTVPAGATSIHINTHDGVSNGGANMFNGICGKSGGGNQGGSNNCGTAGTYHCLLEIDLSTCGTPTPCSGGTCECDATEIAYCESQNTDCSTYTCSKNADGSYGCVQAKETDGTSCGPDGFEDPCGSSFQCSDGECVPSNQEPEGTFCIHPDECEPGCCLKGACSLDICPPKCGRETDPDDYCQTTYGNECATFVCVDYSIGSDWTTEIGVKEDGCILDVVSTVSGCCEDDADCTDTLLDCLKPVCIDYTCEDTPEQGVPCEDASGVEGCCGIDGDVLTGTPGTCLTSEDEISMWCPCKDAPNSWPEIPDIDYDNSDDENLVTDYGNANIASEAEAPVKLTFELNNWLTLKDELIPPANTDKYIDEIRYAAIIFDDENCQGNIIGQTTAPYPHLSSNYQGKDENSDPSVLYPFDLGFITAVIDDVSPPPGDKQYPTLELGFWPSLFRNPFYEQNFACEFNGEDSECGFLRFCVEFQALDDCGRKLDFVDVKIEIMFDLLEDCAGEFCGQIVMQRAPVIEDTTETDIGELACFPCDGDGSTLGAVNPSIVVNQGPRDDTSSSIVDICLDIKPDVDGVCIVNIESLFLEVTRYDENGNPSVKVYPITKEYSGAILVDYVDGSDNPNYEPDIPDKVDYNDATTQILLPQFEFQELKPLDEDGFCDGAAYECTSTVRIHGTVLLGLGCYCEDPTPEDCDETLVPPSRKLQAENALSLATVQGFIDINVEPVVEGTAPDDGCTAFFIVCLVRSVIAVFVKLFTVF